MKYKSMSKNKRYTRVFLMLLVMIMVLSNIIVIENKVRANDNDLSKLYSYYGLRFTDVRILISSVDDFEAVKTLGSASSIKISGRNGKVVELEKNEEGIIGFNELDDTAVNGNLTGVYFEDSFYNVDNMNNAEIHLTIVNR